MGCSQTLRLHWFTAEGQLSSGAVEGLNLKVNRNSSVELDWGNPKDHRFHARPQLSFSYPF